MKLAQGIYTYIINGSKWLVVSKKALDNLTADYRSLIDDERMLGNLWAAVDLSGQSDSEYDLTRQRVVLFATDGQA